MHKKHTQVNAALLLAVACFIWAAGRTELPARAQQAGHDHAGHGHAAHQQAKRPGQHQHPGSAAHAPAAARAPHGGQVTRTALYNVEVVYRPRETRVYLYDSSMRPLAARQVQGRLAMKVRGHEKIFGYPLSYVAPAAGSREQDYLAAKVDVSRVSDGGMTVTFELASLPNPKEPGTTFTQKFALSKIELKVTLAALTTADQSGIARQKVCPVMGTKLGGHGTPVKVLIGDRPVYLCCKGCLGRVQKDPEVYLRKVYPAKSASGGQLTVSTATAADQAAIKAQRVCAVANSPLGGMGTPVKVTINGQSVFLCCKGCLARMQANPDLYVRKAAQLRAGAP